MTRRLLSIAGVLLLGSLLTPSTDASGPAMTGRQADEATVTFTAVTCPAALPLNQVSPETCIDPRDDIVIQYDKILVEVEPITVTTDADGRASIDVSDPANGADFMITQEDNYLFYPQDFGPYPGYGVYLADCGQAGDAAGFFYTGVGIAFDEIANGAVIDCRLSFVPPAPTSPVELVEGSCDAITGLVAELNPLTLPYGEPTGVAVAAPVEVSLSTIGISLDEVLGTDHAVVVYNEDGEGRPILSCGDVGGVFDESGGVAFGMPAQGGSRYSGVGVITPTDADNVDIGVYMAPDLDGSDRDVAGVTGSQRAEAGSPAGVYAGSCDGAGADDLVAELTPVTAPEGDPVGVGTDGAVEGSVSTIDLTLEELVGSDHVIAVFDEDAPDTALVCGPIGGVLGPVAHTFDGTDSLAVGLPALGDSLYSGVAVLTSDGAGTVDVALYLALTLDGNGAQAVGTIEPDQSMARNPLRGSVCW